MKYAELKKMYGGELVNMLYYEKILTTPLTETVLSRIKGNAPSEALRYTCYEITDEGIRTGDLFNFYV